MPLSPRKSLNVSMMSVEEEQSMDRSAVLVEEEEEEEVIEPKTSLESNAPKRQAQATLRINYKRVKLCETPTSSVPAAAAAQQKIRRRKRVSDPITTLGKRLTFLERECERAPMSVLVQMREEIGRMKTEAQGMDYKLTVQMDHVLARVSHRERDVELADSFKSNGNTFFSANMLEDAVRCYRKACELDPCNPVHYSNCAAALIGLGQFDHALVLGERAIQRDPHFPRAYLRCAQAHLGLGKLDLAMEKVNMVLQMDTNNTLNSKDEAKEMQRRIDHILALMADAHNMIVLERPSSAWNRSLELLKMVPNSVQAKLLEITSRMLMATKTTQRSSSEPTSALIKTFMKEIESSFAKSHPQEASQHLCVLGQTMWKQGLFCEATQYFYAAKAWAPLDETTKYWWDLCSAVDSAVRRAKKLQDDAKFEDSLVACGEALELTHNNAVLSAKILVMRSNNYALLRKYKEAEMDCTRALELSPLCVKARLAKARIFLSQAMFQRVEEELTQVEARFASSLKQAYIDEISSMRETVRRRMAAAAAEQQQQQQRARQQEYERNARREVPPTRSPPKSGRKENARPRNSKASSPAAATKLPFGKNATHYAVLGIEITATSQEARKAYMRLARKYHPDKNPDPTAAECFKRIAAAAETLLSPTKKRNYDMTMPYY